MKLSQTSLRWIGAAFFLLSAMVEYSEKAYVSSLASVLLAALLIPPLARAIYARVPRTVPTAARVGLGLALFFLVVATSSSNTEQSTTTPTQSQQVTTNTPAPTPQASVQPSPTESPTPNTQTATLLRVIDGDTVEVSLNGKKETIRVIGINTPETVDPRKSVACFGKEATQNALNYFEQSGSVLWLEVDPSQGERDKYNRLLRYIFTHDGMVDYGRATIALGFANEYTYNVPYKYQELYKQAEREAREAKKGLWADDACPAPTAKPTIKPTTAPKAPATVSAPSSSGGKSCEGPDLDCGDFSSRAEVLQFWNACGFSASNDPHRLDGNDHDGQPCESL